MLYHMVVMVPPLVDIQGRISTLSCYYYYCPFQELCTYLEDIGSGHLDKNHCCPVHLSRRTIPNRPNQRKHAIKRTHMDDEGSVTIFFGALFYPSAHNARRRVK